MWQLKNLNHRTILNYMGKTKITKEIINFSKNSLVSSLETTQKEKERTFYSNKFNSASKYPVPCLILSWILKWILLHFLVIQTTFYWIPTYKLTYIRENLVWWINFYFQHALVVQFVRINPSHGIWWVSFVLTNYVPYMEYILMQDNRGGGGCSGSNFQRLFRLWLIWISAGM